MKIENCKFATAYGAPILGLSIPKARPPLSGLAPRFSIFNSPLLSHQTRRPKAPTLHAPALHAILSASLALASIGSCAAAFDAAPFGLPLPEGNGVVWDDPREIHQIIVQFDGPAPPPSSVHLDYWGSRWPQQRLPKDRQPGGGDVGWMELGNWYNGGWRPADAEARAEASQVTFSFRPVNEKEYPQLKDYAARFRYTLKIRVRADAPLPRITRLQALTDSVYERRAVRLAWEQPPLKPQIQVFNGQVQSLEQLGPRDWRITFDATANPDPNTLDRTLLTVSNGGQVFTFGADDATREPLFLPCFGVAALPGRDSRDYAAIAAWQRGRRQLTLYDRVAQLPEQTWPAAWNGLPPKKSRICFPLGTDGGRQRFLLLADGSVMFRSNDRYLQNRPGRDTPRLELEPASVWVRFGPLPQPAERHLEEESIPICHTAWELDGLQVSQTALLTQLDGAKAGPPPPADATAVFLARFIITNLSPAARTATLPLTYTADNKPRALRADDQGRLWLDANLRGQVLADPPPAAADETSSWSWTLAPGQSKTLVVKLPYLVLTEKSEQTALERLDFDAERAAVAAYWRRRLDESARLITPEPVLDCFYRAEPGHLLINCEREPDSTRRFARVGSFNYGVYGNESCMMVVDLDRRGYHREAQECLEAWLHYQSSVALPGDFASKQGVLYGAGGYEAGGYNQHHGWILWCLAEHYRFTRDAVWLRRAAPGLVAGADWIIGETARTAARQELERGLLPPGSLEDIGDWWTWLSTSCYTWRGLDSAAWALEQIRHPQAKRIRLAADAFHASLLANFRHAARRSPVVRLRDGTAVPHFPSYVQRRGRSFGWICETLEGALHLLITGALDSHSPEADWILKDYEDNLYLSNQYGYTLDDFDRLWFGRGGMSMQACLLLGVEPYLARDDAKHALRAMFNAIAVSHFPDVHINTEHALPEMGDWRGDHYKTSDEANACGWLRQLFLREQADALLVGQAVPRQWLEPGRQCGLQRAATWFGPASILYTPAQNQITAQLDAPSRNPPSEIRLRFRDPLQRPLRSVTLDGKPWTQFKGDWVQLPGNIGSATVVARF